MKKKIVRIIKALDFFSVDIGFNIKKKDDYGTLLGGFVFLAYIVVTLYFIFANFFSFVDRSNFNQNTTETTLDGAPKIDLLNPDMVFGFGLAVNSIANEELYSKYLTLQILHISLFKANNSKIKTPVNLSRCTKADFHNKMNKSYDLLSLQNYSCINKSAYGSDFGVEGIFTQENFSYLEFSVNVAPYGLANQAELMEFFSKNILKLQLYYLESSINVSNYSSPNKLYINTKYIQLSYAFAFKTNVDFSNNTFINDANILFVSETDSNYYSIGSYEPMNTFLGTTRMTDKYADYNLFGRFYVRSSQVQLIIKRTYQKFTEFLADATAIVSQLLFIIMLLMEAYNKFRATESVIDGIIRYKQKLTKKAPKGFNIMRDVFENNMEYHEKNINIETEFHRKTSSMNTQKTIFTRTPTVKYTKVNVVSVRNNLQAQTKKTELDSDRNYNYRQVLETQTSSDRKRNPPLYSEFLPGKTKESHKYLNTLTSNLDPYNQTEASAITMDDLSMKYSFCDLVKSILFKIGIKTSIIKKENMFELGMQYYLLNLDIFTYFAKMREIELIKYFIFNDNERKVLDFLSKPSVSSIITDTNSPLRNTRKEFLMSQEDIIQLYSAFQKIYTDYKIGNRRNDKLERILKETSYEIHQLLQEK